MEHCCALLLYDEHESHVINKKTYQQDMVHHGSAKGANAGSTFEDEQVDSVAFVLGVGHHIVISYHQDEYENTEKICKESKVLIVEHLQAQVEYVASIPHQKQEAVFLQKT